MDEYLEEGTGRPEMVLNAIKIGLNPFTSDSTVKHILETTETDVRTEHFVKGVPDEF